MPLEPSGGGTLHLWTPPGAPIDTSGVPEVTPKPPGNPIGSQGPHRIHKVNMLKTMEILTFGLQDLKRNCFGQFGDAPRALPRHPRVSTHVLGGVSGAQNASRDSPRPSQDPPGPPGNPLGPPCEFQCRYRFNKKLQLYAFTYISHCFYQFSIAILPLQIGPCQLLLIFPIDFDNFTPPRPLPEPSQDPSRELPGAPKTPPSAPQDQNTTLHTPIRAARRNARSD